MQFPTFCDYKDFLKDNIFNNFYIKVKYVNYWILYKKVSNRFFFFLYNHNIFCLL